MRRARCADLASIAHARRGDPVGAEWADLLCRHGRLADGAPYEAHYNGHRSHRGRALRPPGHYYASPVPVTGLASAGTQRRNVLGWLIHEYQQAA